MGMKESQAESNLKHQTITGLGWRSLTTGGRILLRLSVGVILARLLGPEAFGLIGLATIVIGFGDLFVDIGLGPAIVQRKTLTERHVRVGFTFSLFGGLSLAVLIFSFAPLVARLMGDKALMPIIEWLALTFVFSGGGVVARSLLKRRINFRAVLFVDLGSYIIGYGGVGITMALLGYGVWSLVAASLVQAGIGALIAYGLSSHSLYILFSWQEIRELGEFGTGLTLSRLINYVALKGDYLVVGRTLGPGSLGLYTRSYKLMKTPLTHLVRVLVDVLFPALSRIQDQPERMRRVFRRAISVIVFFTAPVVGMIILLAPEIIVGLYGEQWRGAVVPLQILGGAGVCRALYNAAAAFVKAHGDVFKIAVCQGIYAISTVGGAWIGAHYYGLNGASAGVAGSIFLMYFMIMYLAQSVTGIGTWENIKAHAPGSIFAIPVVGCGYAGKLAAGYLGTGGIMEMTLSIIFAFGVGVLIVGVVPQRWIKPVSSVILETANDYLPRWLSDIFTKLIEKRTLGFQ
jgi:O-antigen/teichoic acid export membrane protein